MKTTKEVIDNILNKVFYKELNMTMGVAISIDDIPELLISYAEEAIKADRKNLLNYAKAKENPSDYGTGEIWVDKNSIINAPNIELL